MFEWLGEHQARLYWMSGISIVVLVAALSGSRAVIVRLPADYLTHRNPPPLNRSFGPFAPGVVRVAKNLLGLICMIAGLAMLVLPGPDMVVVLVGILMVDFPGKYRFEKWLFSWPRVLNLTNALRRRNGRPPLQAPIGS